MASQGSEITDRRVLRGLRNREAVVEAVISLIEEGDLNPSAAVIAERAGVSLRSIYHHFTDLDDVSRAVADRMFTMVAELYQPIPTDGPFDERLKAYVKQRTTLAERSLAMHQASNLAAPSSEAVATRLAFTNDFFRDLTAQVFAIELRAAAPWKLEALDSLTSLDGWVRLRVNQRLSLRKATAVLKQSIPAILDAP